MEGVPLPTPSPNEGTDSGRDVNLYSLYRERQELRKSLHELGVIKEGNPEAEVYKEGIKEITDQVSKFRRDKKVHKEYVQNDREYAPKEGFIDEVSIAKEFGSVYTEIAYASDKVEDSTKVINQNLQKISLENDPYKRKVLERVVKSFETKRNAYSEIYHAAEYSTRSKDKRAIRAHDLVGYKKGLHAEGHIAMTPCVKAYVQEIEKKMLTGDPMFLHGPTGTGKTSLGRLASEVLTGKTAEMVYCNQQTRESNIWGKTGVRGDGKGGSETFDILGPLARSIREGKPIIFDEFNSLEEDQMRMIKGVFGYKPGDEVPVTGNGKIKMAPGFQIICTANLKSEKHPDRRDLPDEIKREFEQNNIEIGYNPKHESFDIMLARLMNPDGSLDLSWHDINTTLPKLAEAMESIQQAYSGDLNDEEAKSIGVMSAANKKAGLKSFVMTQGSVESIFDQWKVEGKMGKHRKTFTEFVDERIKTALTFKAYGVEDRTLAAKIFALKGFLKTVSAEDLDLPKDIFSGVKIKSERGGKEKAEEVKERSAKVGHVTLTELTDLDPFDVREKLIDPISEFAPANNESAGDIFSRSIEERLRKISGKEAKDKDITSISSHYEYKNSKTGAIEHAEDITLSIEVALDKYTEIYKETGIDLPPDFKEQIEDIWSRNRDEIEKAVAEKGFDEVIVAPADIPLEEIKDKMKMENGYFTGSNFDSGGGFAGAKSVGVDKVRVILAHAAQNLVDHPELKSTLGVKTQDVNIEETLSLEDYIIFQRQYFKVTGKHLDSDSNVTWTPRTKSGARFVNSNWHSGYGRLHVGAGDAAHSSSSLGCRSSRYFS